MRRRSIKLKLTLWFTVFMVVLAAIIFSFITVVSGSTTTRQLRNALVGLVDGNMGEVEYDDGHLEIEDDFRSFREGVYCLIFSKTGERLRGYAPYAELEVVPFEDGTIRTVDIGGESYLLYDRLVPLKHGEAVWMRGTTPEGGSAMAVPAVYQAVLIALPLLVLLAAVGGYLLAGRSLRPIQEISDTAEEIGSSGNLSKRIALESSGDELHKLAGTFNRMFDRLEVNFEAERQFTADASHELRTPVSVILAQCEYAFENAAGEGELYEAIGAIQKQGYRMSRIIESLLHVTRMEQRTEAADFAELDLSALVGAVCAEHRAVDEKQITLTAEIQPDLTARADGALMARLLENLIGNAYRYGRENGTIHVGLREDGGELCLSVADDGVGIPPEEQPKIWNRFYRVEQSRSAANGAGLGLGLSMVKQIAELHSGTVQVESTPGRGSVFTVRLPRQ